MSTNESNDDSKGGGAKPASGQVLPACHEVHSEARGTPNDEPLTRDVSAQPADSKSPARWAYERLILYIGNFEKQLDNEHEVAMGFAGGDAGVLRIEGMGYFDPDIVTFYGSDPAGSKTQLIQHVTQLSVILRALPRPQDAPEARRIGFRLAADLASD